MTPRSLAIRRAYGRRFADVPERSDLGQAIIECVGDDATLTDRGVTAWLKLEDFVAVKATCRGYSAPLVKKAAA